jgi:hypothetical protein
MLNQQLYQVNISTKFLNGAEQQPIPQKMLGHRKSKSMDIKSKNSDSKLNFWKVGGKKSPRKEKSPIFGVPLSQVLERQSSNGNSSPIPEVVSLLISYLDKEGTCKLKILKNYEEF